MWLPLRTALNLRDVGGLPVAGGGSVRPRTLLRSGSLRQLSPADAATLVAEFGLRTVVDLRTPEELAVDGPSNLAKAGVATAHLPLISDVDDAVLKAQGDTDAVRVLTDAYQAFLDQRGEHLVTAARLVAWTGSGSVLVHCAAGKDRTGVTIAVLLDAVGVERAAVLADYDATNEVIDDVLASLVAALGDESMISRVPLAMKRAQPDALRAVLDRMDRDYGGAAGWLRSHGFDDTELDLLRHRLVERPA
ncbi:MAG: protein-tyrosine phosphatase [Pseudonocardiales bacterium]|nr:protein-tyrosine phosphatase [Pseudonocardiales bacterium]